MQWYGDGPTHCAELVMFTPEHPTSHHWALVLHRTMLSPNGNLLAVAIGDLDGDGRDDLAFVAEGVDSCEGRTPTGACKLLWVKIFASHSSAWSTDESETVLNHEDWPSMQRRLAITDEFAGPERARWTGRIESGGRYVVTASHGGRQAQWLSTLANGAVSMTRP
jgi:hypothetical protein